ncbi:FAD-binding oxidoreductase [Luteolibacter arcticus]|uniref:FAD-binding oxidoreductase n=1 Tax=Luteolibacter arcticus TaxID=1581411 RepID=A0ABT3GNP4_9BACT|nr:FAD-binding oxidoreductase [Luteolibacter arcticus]MCW1925150.1 FAD-binding oxidoreductase [Luteolibacter arcticus]
MDLVSSQPFWLLKNGLPELYPPLERDERCDVAVIGAGITGALMAEKLTSAGHKVIVLDRRDVATGSTSASTALLQYEIDRHLIELEEQYGEELARTAYLACYESVSLLEERVKRLGLDDSGFVSRDSIYLASRPRDAKVLEAEAAARERAGIPVEIWHRADLLDRLAVDRSCALHSTRGAQVDPYLLAHGLLEEVVKRGSGVYDRTAVSSVEVTRSGVTLRTDRGPVVRAKRLVVAAGYEAGKFIDLRGRVDLNSSFAIASEPLAAGAGWWRGAMIWESSRPYLYCREVSDGRILVGGDDVPFRTPAARDAMIKAKASRLERRFRRMMPALEWEPAFSWAGTFAETRDGLAYIGSCRDHPLCYFALGFGGNGIVFSVIAAEIICDDLVGKVHPWAKAFRFDR